MVHFKRGSFTNQLPLCHIAKHFSLKTGGS